MGLLRNRRDEPAAGSRYQMRQRLLSIGDDYWIEHEDGTRAFRVDGKALRIRKTLVLEDTTGREVAKLQERKLSVRDKMEIERDGRSIATVKKALVGIRDRFSIDVEGGADLAAKGNLARSRVRDQAGRRHDRDRVEALVRGARQLRCGDRARRG